jgi:hypothetical protein
VGGKQKRLIQNGLDAWKSIYELILEVKSLNIQKYPLFYGVFLYILDIIVEVDFEGP